ncbi:MAG: penicillin-binding protein 2 [Hungatella sp.]|nr:penicillin-binding protein 2 [Hungatella sp.]
MKTSRTTDHGTGERRQGQQPRKKVFAKYMQEKLAVMVFVIMLALFALILILFKIVRENNEEYTKVVLSQHSTYDSRVIPYRRGDIVDRNGTYLATSDKVYNLILDPVQIYDKEELYLNPTVNALVEIFGYNRNELLETLMDHRESRYLRYERRMNHEKKEAFEALQQSVNQSNYENGISERIRGVWFEDEFKRIYPYNSLACSIIGFTSADGSEGNGGIEQYYNSSLIGTNGREYGYLNDDTNMEAVIKPARNGSTIVSTIDIYIQDMVEKRIEEWQEDPGSKHIGILVMDPNNGEILAMADNSRYDLNNPRDLSGLYTQEEIDVMTDQEKVDALSQMWRNFCVSDTYEPGSPAKVFTVATGLEENVFQTTTHFDCDGLEEIGGHKIKCTAYAKGGHKDLTVEETLIVSCNDAMMHMAAMEGKETFTKYQTLFNFGSRTGIDLPGEADAASLIYRVERMDATSLATNGFGQNFNCTMVQMAAAFASVINGGSYYEPHVVKRILNENGAVIMKNDGVLVRETVSDATSRFMREALRRTVAEGTGKAAQVEGYEVGGKTGTAEKTGRNKEDYVVSFCGFAPADHPKVLVYVVIDEPAVEKQASSSYASRVFSKVMGDILPYLNIFPMTDETEEDLSDPGQIPEREGVSQMGEEETPAESRVYETDEVVPDETNEDGSPVVSDLPDLLLDPEGNPPETSSQDESQPESSRSQESSQETTAQEPETAESSNPGQ